MCGIAGVYKARGEVDVERLERATESLAHRGPDDQGLWRDGSVALGHRRLSIIDLPGGHQPLATEDGKLQLVANGEIYNFIELRAELETAGHRFRTRSDCETLLHAYRGYGDSFLERACGMFAFALYDVGSAQLLLARDRLGQKPLFFAETADGVFFASEIKAVLALLPTAPHVNPAGLARYLQHQFASGRETVLEGVQRVLPGECITVQAGRVTARRRYWRATDIMPRELDFETASAEFDALFDQVMREHERADVPFGLFLSGGVDSSTLLGALSRLRDQPLETFSVGFDAPGMVDELPLAAQVAAHHGSCHHPVAPDAQALMQRLPRTIWAADELMRDYANLPTLYLAEQASQSLKVVFSGEGGDEVFAGYGRYRVSRLERWFKTLVARGSGGFRTGGLIRGRSRRLLGEPLRESVHASREPFIEAWRETPSEWSDLQRMQCVDLVTALPDNLLVKADRMLMAHSLEGRLPLVDHRVVEFGLSLPDALKVNGDSGKTFLKRWAQRLVPAELLNAPKRGFHVPLRSWFVPELNRMRRCLPAYPVIREWFDPQAVDRLLQADEARRQCSPTTVALVQFALWHRLIIEDGGRDPGLCPDPLALLES